MSASGDRLTELKRAYRILGVPLDASTRSIKTFHRRLVKRWHPDLYRNGTTAHAEATQMTKLINDAYSTIAHAPLRYYVEIDPQQTNRRSGHTTHRPLMKQSVMEDLHTERIEFWVRFFLGAVFGMFVSLELFASVMPRFLSHPASFALGVLILILGFAFVAARYGNKLWPSDFRRWWLWP